jgi:hypothetical protein
MKTRRSVPDHFKQQGWQGQFDRMERWHQRALGALSGRNPDLDDAEDFVYAFCQSAYHLRDWLRKSGAASQAELDALMQSTPALKLCRDVCNGSKHLTLDDTTTTERIGLMREYIPPFTKGETGGVRPRLFAFEDLSGSVQLVDISELMRECATAWRNFCALRPEEGSGSE